MKIRITSPGHDDLPRGGVKPYAGGTGWSGQETSKMAAEFLDSSGLTAKRQRQALDMLEMAGPHGMTSFEYEEKAGIHHGSASGPLSTLHKTHYIARLRITRVNPQTGQQCGVYVMPHYVQGRETTEHASNKKKADLNRIEEIARSITDRVPVEAYMILDELGVE